MADQRYGGLCVCGQPVGHGGECNQRIYAERNSIPSASPFPPEVVERAYHEARRNPDGSVSDGVHAALVTVGEWLNKQSPYGEPVFPQHVIAEAYGRYRAKAGSKAGLYSALAVIADYLRSEEVRERVRDELNMSPREELETDPADAVLRAILP